MKRVIKDYITKNKNKKTLILIILAIFLLIATPSYALFKNIIKKEGSINTVIPGYCTIEGIKNFKECLIRSEYQNTLEYSLNEIDEKTTSFLSTTPTPYIIEPKITYIEDKNETVYDVDSGKTYSRTGEVYYSYTEPTFNTTNATYYMQDMVFGNITEDLFTSEKTTIYSCMDTRTNGQCKYLYIVNSVTTEPTTNAQGEEVLKTTITKGKRWHYKVASSSGANYGLFKAEDDYTDTSNLENGDYSYYYRGEVNNNWVEFAGYLWRIVRINGNGSIRLIYAGLSQEKANSTSTDYHNGDYSVLLDENNKPISTRFNDFVGNQAMFGYMYNEKLVKMPSVEEFNSVDYVPQTYLRSNINNAKKYYFFSNFDYENDCVDGMCTLTGYQYIDEENNIYKYSYIEDTYIDNLDKILNGDEYSTYDKDMNLIEDENGNPVEQPYKYLCWSYNTRKVTTDPNNSKIKRIEVTCPAVSMIVEPVEGNDTHAMVSYAGFMPESYESTLMTKERAQEENTKSSTIKQKIDNWYENNILNTKYEDYLSNEIFCQDMGLFKGTGIGYDSTEYQANNRTYTGKPTPTYICPNINIDSDTNGTYTNSSKYTLKTNAKGNIKGTDGFGNNALDYPIGMLTVDELTYAGTRGNQMNQKFYLYNGLNYYLMSPNMYLTNSQLTRHWIVTNVGGTLWHYADANIRPVINLSKDVLYLSGTGLIDDEAGVYDPYKLTLFGAAGEQLSTYLADNKDEIDDLWDSELEDDGIRYVGSGALTSETSPDNFICFGTDSLEECKANEEKYMYRIIGVFQDEQGLEHVKVVKFKQLGTYEWNTDNSDVNWGDSSLYKGLNGEYFLTNTNYDYLQD